MAIVTTDRRTLEHLTGVDVFTFVLATRSWLTSRLAWPIAVLGAQGPTLIVRDLERANVASSGVCARVKYFSPYPSVGRVVAADCVPTVEEAVFEVAAGERLELEGDIPALLALRILAKASNAQIKSTTRTPFLLTQISRGQVLEAFNRAKESMIPTATESAKLLPDGEDLIRHFDTMDRRFATLDDLLGEVGADGLLASSPLTIQDLGGPEALGATYLFAPRGANEVFALRPAEAGDGSLGAAPAHDLPAAIEQIAGQSGKVAYEEEWMPAGDWLKLSEGLSLLPLGRRLSSWRERIAQFDLPAYLLIARIGLPAVEAALSQTGRIVRTGASIRESEVERIYQQKVAENSAALHAEDVEIWFTLLHSSKRTSHPAFSTNAVIDRDSRGVRLIPGLMHKSKSKLILGTAEFARSLPLTTEADAMYRALRCAAKASIKVIKPGVTGEQVHAAALQALQDSVDASRDARLHVARFGTVSEVFRRDVGLLVGKEQSFGSAFKPGAQAEFFEGAIGIVEIQWVTEDLALGYGDMFFVTDSHATRLGG